MGLSVATVQEIRPISDNPMEVAQALDSEIVYLAGMLVKAFRSWSRIGQIVVLVDRGEHWKRLGYKSHGAWLVSVETRTGYCRASLYHFKDKFLEIENHPHVEDLIQMTEGTMEVFRQLPEKLQRDPEIKERAKKSTRAKNFREHIAETQPEAHIEVKEKVELNLEASFLPIFHEFMESIRVIEEEPTMSYERAFELALISWCNEIWGDSEAGITNLARARQLRELK